MPRCQCSWCPIIEKKMVLSEGGGGSNMGTYQSSQWVNKLIEEGERPKVSDTFHSAFKWLLVQAACGSDWTILF